MSTSTSDPLVGVFLKIRRANRHLADLDEAIKTALDRDRYSFTLEFDPQTNSHVYTAHGVPAIDADWSLIVGEILYNLRSALDYLAWQLVILDGGTPGDKTQVPVRASPFNKKGEWVTPQLQPPVSNPQVLDALEEVQPYRGPEGEPAAFHDSPLWRLGILNNIDKHRLLLVVVCVLDVGEMWWTHQPEQPAPNVRISTSPVEDGSPVAWFDFHGHEPPPDFDPHLALAVAINEAETPEIHLVPLSEALTQLIWWVEFHIVQMRFASLFP